MTQALKWPVVYFIHIIYRRIARAMRITARNIDIKFKDIKEASSWNNQSKEELKMHKIHVYPAKFPSFLISKSLSYARRKRVDVQTIGDIFCGCGTTALEAKRNDKTFWGCDINPVATLIAKVKRERYDDEILSGYFLNILERYKRCAPRIPKYIRENERLQYWFLEGQMEDLYKLLFSIRHEVSDKKYRDFFLVAFSNILKRTSRWLTKSIKPQVDPKKAVNDVQTVFKIQFNLMARAVKEANKTITTNPSFKIVNKNFLKTRCKSPFVDMLITSPPYVTSYEYADLHQLSTMWLGYTEDFRDLRDGTIGSLHHADLKEKEIIKLDPIATETYNKLTKARTKRPKAALKYFMDIMNTVDKAYAIIRPGGLAVFVIGNTTHKKVYIDNAKYLTKCMLGKGFENIEVFKRKISSKILTPYRSGDGKFSNNKNHKKIYSYEFVIIAQKPNIRT